MNDHKHQIALLHAEHDDVHLVSSLLCNEPFDVVSHKDMHSLADDLFESEISPTVVPSTFGVVVCARGASKMNNQSSAGFTDHLTDELAQLTGRYKRVLVLADSMDENTVCTYLSAGAHHVIALDESPRLMQARLVAGLRLHKEPVQDEWKLGPYHFDLSRRAVRMDGKNLRLSPREFELARYLFEHRERIISIPELLDAVWSLPETTDSRRIDTAACRLRKKMSLGLEGVWQLRRLRREGYQLIKVNAN